MTSVTIKTDGMTYAISCEEDGMAFEEFMRLLVEPAIASCYSQQLLDEWYEPSKGE